MISSVSLVIPVLNAWRSLPRTLSAVGQLEPPPDEVLLVDNGSTDASPDLIRHFVRGTPHLQVRQLHEARRGASAARNTGIRTAMGEIVAFTDADCAPQRDWLQHLMPPFHNAAVGGVAGRVVPAPPRGAIDLLGTLYTLQLPEQPARHHRWTPWEGGFPTANLAIRRNLLETLGGFDEQVGIYGEDHDLCARLYDRGFEIVYAPEACVAHHHRTTLAGMLRQAFGFGRSHAYLLRRCAQGGLWIELPRSSLNWGACPVRAWIDLASADKKALVCLAAGIVYPAATLLLALFAVWLAAAAGRQARRAGSPVTAVVATKLAGLLLAKSAAMTAGRWWGSLRYGSLCL